MGQILSFLSNEWVKPTCIDIFLLQAIESCEPEKSSIVVKPELVGDRKGELHKD